MYLAGFSHSFNTYSSCYGHSPFFTHPFLPMFTQIHCPPFSVLLCPQEADSCMIRVPGLAGFHLGLVDGRNQQSTQRPERQDGAVFPLCFLSTCTSFLTMDMCFQEYRFCWVAWCPTVPTATGGHQGHCFLSCPFSPSMTMASHFCQSLGVS